MDLINNSSHFGSGHINNIHNVYINTNEYKSMINTLDDLNTQRTNIQKQIFKYPKDHSFKFELLSIEVKIDLLNKKIEQLKKDFTSLYDSFNKIEVSSKRLEDAYIHFFKGEYKKADKVLDVENLDIEVNLLLQDKRLKEEELKNVNEKLGILSEEFLLKAKLWCTFIDDPNWQSMSNRYFLSSINTYKGSKNQGDYAKYLYDLGDYTNGNVYLENTFQLTLSESLEEDFITIQLKLGTMLVSKAKFYSANKEKSKAIECYHKAVNIYKTLIPECPSIYLNHYIDAISGYIEMKEEENDLEEAKEALHNAAYFISNLWNEFINKEATHSLVLDVVDFFIFHGDFYSRNNLKIESIPSYQYALDFLYRLVYEQDKENPHLKNAFNYIATTLNNLGNVFKDISQFDKAEICYKECINTRRDLYKKLGIVYASNLAISLQNLGNLYLELKKYPDARILFFEALKLTKLLNKNSTYLYGGNYATILCSISIWYGDTKKPKIAIKYIDAAILVLENISVYKPSKYLPELADAIQLKATYLKEMNEYIQGFKLLKKSELLFRQIIDSGDRTVEPNFGTNLIYISSTYSTFNKFEKSNTYALEALTVLKSYSTLLRVKKDYEIIKNILINNGHSNHFIANLFNESA